MFHHLHRIGDRIDRLLEALWNVRGTDLLLTVGLPPMTRVDGELRPVPGEPALQAADTDALLAEVLTEEQGQAWAAEHEYDFSFSWREHARIRGNAFTQRGMTAVALRMIPRTIPTPDDLGLPAILRELAMQHQGLILMTGPTGSGKSTTLASLVDLINTNRACHIITVEDPIEYVHDHKRSAVNQREVGTDTGNFHKALRSVLREDPDVLLVGEMRDLESIQFALTVAETGHLVFATLHTNDTAQSLGRMIDVFPAEQQAQIKVQLASALSCVVYQRLIPRIGGGMTAAYEVLVANSAVRNLIKEGK
ncbi:MAG: type IV pilus twitching motility protein PilT, partial [Marmoricola sp.]